MSLAEMIIESAKRYSGVVIEQFQSCNLNEQEKQNLSRYLVGAFISGMATMANSQIVTDGSPVCEPHAVLKACGEATGLLGEQPLTSIGGGN